MNKREPAFILKNRQKEREIIADQVEAFLSKGGEIQVLRSTLDQNSDPKCRIADEIGFYR